MRNLSLSTAIQAQLNVNSELRYLTLDSTSRVLYTISNTHLYGINVDNGKIEFKFDYAEACCVDEKTKINCIQHLTEMNSIFMSNNGGDLMHLSLFEREVEIVGHISDGLSAVEWSPDQELVVLVSSTHNMLLMSKDFNLICEKSLNNEEFGQAEFINVGWGKVETQFHGTEGKQAAQQKKERKFNELHYDWDDMKPKVDWSTDAEYYVISVIDTLTNARRFQVFTREGVLYSTSEFVLSMEPIISWKNSKALLSTATHRANKHEIVFFEPNGLAHGGFTLPFAIKEYKINGIYWNSDSSVLCVWCERLDSTESILQLWTVGNYHWYLKYSAKFEKHEKIESIMWDCESSLCLHVLLSSSKYIRYLFGWSVDSCYSTLDYNGSVAVIDGASILVTPFGDAVIPPPMCGLKINTPAAVNKVIWSPINLDLMLLSFDGYLLYFKYGPTEMIDPKKLEIVSGRPYEPNKTSIYAHFAQTKLENPLSVQHINWLHDNQIATVSSLNRELFVEVYSIEMHDMNNLELSKMQSFQVKLPVINTSYNLSLKTLALQLSDGSVFTLKNEAFEPFRIENGIDFKFPQTCSQFALCSSPNNSSFKPFCVGLTDFYRFYVNNKELANNCTSFYVHDRYILLTNHENHLKFIDLNKNDEAFIDESHRRIERGAKLVHCVHNSTICVLQMPRGNLEAINPRILTIMKIKELIDSFEYQKALEIIRKNRINMNIIYDHNPKEFISNIEKFITQIENITHLNLFVTELVNENVTETLYKNMYQLEKVNTNQQDIKNKIETVCKHFIATLEKLNNQKYYLTLLSCYAKRNQLDEALKIIRITNDEVKTEQGLRHLLYLADVNELFDIALGTYDFDVVIMVAEKSQKDPKEYLPFLNELKSFEENYRKYKIDLYLKRYKKALDSIVKCVESHLDEFHKFVKEQKLYSDALRHFNVESDIYQELSKEYGNYLCNKKYYQEAGLVLLKAKLLDEALDAFEKSMDWKMYLCVCSQLKVPQSQLNEKLKKITMCLKENNKHAEAALVYEDYLNDCEEAIATQIQGQHWDDAIRLMHKYNRLDFIQTNLIPAIKSFHHDYIEKIKTSQTTFSNYVKRLCEVRVEKKEKMLKEQLENNDDIPENDNMSQASSVMEKRSTTASVKSAATSINSQFSTRTSRNAQKLKKKAISLKKGSTNEDLALIQELKDLINEIYGLQDSITLLNRTLMLFSFDHMALELQQLYEDILNQIDADVNQIWDFLNQPVDSYQRFNSIFQSSETDYAKLDLKYRYPPIVGNLRKTSWKLHV